MKKLFALVLAMLLLSGCAAAPAETTAGTEPAPSVTTAPRTEPTAPPATAPTTLPTEPAVPYDTFFSQEIVRPVDYHFYRLFLSNDQITGPDKGTFFYLVDDSSLEFLVVDPELLGYVVLCSRDGDIALRPLSDEKMSVAKPASAEYCAAISEDHSVLWKLPYAENAQPEALYTDPFSRISQPYFFENCLFFLAGVDEDTDGIYRLYVPENRLDLLVKDLPPMTGDLDVTYDVISNVTVAWEIYYKITEAQMEEYWETPGLISGSTPHEFCQEMSENPDIQVADLKDGPNREWMHRYERELDGLLYEDQGKYSIFRYYADFLTGETREAYGYPTWSLYPRVYYPDGSMRTSDEDMNYQLWWLDSYYQKK
ncbi:MAG: acid shock protein [Firmicutes bacterium]|nr:acid shock protein [Bacillota bacterium]